MSSVVGVSDPDLLTVAEVSDLGVSPRSAFTLIELLVVILIIGILAALAMAVMFSAQEAARRSRTEGFIGVLNSQMAYRWESYRTRRIQTSLAYADALDYLKAAYEPNQPDIQRLAAMQLIARRQLMRIELPDRWWDVAFDDSDWDAAMFNPPNSVPISTDASGVNPEPIYNGADGPVFDSSGNGVPRLFTFPTPAPGPPGTPPPRLDPYDPANFLDPLPNPFSEVSRVKPSWVERTSLALAYQRRYQQVIQQRGVAPTNQFQGAECLYMILTTGMGDEASGGGTFNERDSADVDDDGMPEFVDGWGRPISFLRWAPGFRSDMQSGDPDKDHDPFDPRRVDTIAFRLFPLIVSSGPDGVNDDGVNVPMGIESHALPGDSDSDAATANTDFDSVNLNDPYAPRKLDNLSIVPSGYIFRGHRFEESAGIGPNDNIFNQALQVR